MEQLKKVWFGREREVTRLCELLGDPDLALPLYIHGPSGCGKSSVLRDVLDALNLPYAHINCIASSTSQGLFDSTLNQLANHRPSSTNGYSSWASCDSVTAFVAGLRRLIAVLGRVCIVFDKAERLSGQGSHLLQTLIELPSLCAAAAAAADTGAGLCDAGKSTVGGVLPIFVGETLWGDFQRFCEGDPRVVHFRFPGYSMHGLGNVLKRDVHVVQEELDRRILRRKLERHPLACTGKDSSEDAGCMETIHDNPTSAAERAYPTCSIHCHSLSTTTTSAVGPAARIERPNQCTAFETFVSSFVDTFSEVCRDTQELRYLCRQLFPLYLQPAVDGEVALSDTHRLSARSLPHLRRALRSVYGRDGLSQESTAARVAAQGIATTGSLLCTAGLSTAVRPRCGAFLSDSSLGSSVQLPTAAQFLLLASFLASRLPPRADMTLFSSVPSKACRKPFALRDNRLAGATHAFSVERLLAIYAAIALPESKSVSSPVISMGCLAPAHAGVTPCAAHERFAAMRAPSMRTELLVQVASLVDVGLLARSSRDAHVDAMQLRCQAPKEVVQGVGAALKFDLRQFEEAA